MEREIGYAAGLGINAVRIRASPTAYKAGPAAFTANFDAFLEILEPHGIVALPLLFDTGDVAKAVSEALGRTWSA